MTKGRDEGRAVVGIVGLGDMGQLMGLALQRVKGDYEVVGHDPDAGLVKAARRGQAVDRTHWNLIAVAEESDLLILTEPLEETLATLAAVAPHLKNGCVVTDTLPAKQAVIAQADEVLPPHASFVGGHPVLRQASTAPEAGALVGVPYCLVPSPRASEAALEVVAGFVAAVGAEPFFIDAAEHDTLNIGVGILPYLASAALLRLVAASPSVRDLRRLAGLGMHHAAQATDEGDTYRAAIRSRPEYLAPWLDGLIAHLTDLRAAVAAHDAGAIDGFFEATEAARGAWAEAGKGDAVEAQAALEELKKGNPVMDTLFGRRRRRKG